MDEHPAYVREGAWHVLSFNFTDWWAINPLTADPVKTLHFAILV